MPDVASFMDYGALGLIGIIIATLVVVAHKGADHIFQQRGIDADARRKRLGEQNGFMRRLIEQEEAERKEATKERANSQVAFEKLVDADIEAKQKLAETLGGLCDQMKDARLDAARDRGAAVERHHELLSEVRQV